MATAQKRKVNAKPATPAKTRLAEPHEIALSSNTQNAVGIMSWSKFCGVSEANLQGLCNDLGDQTEKVQAGDMRPVEGMLYRQAKVLETMFTSLARRAANQEHLKQFQANLTLALKAQAQCRSTLEALAEIKNPRSVAFVKQANLAQGHQQVNNTYATPPAHDGITTQYAQSHTHAGNFQSEQNKLLEQQDGNHLDTRAQSATSQANPHLEAMETVNRAKVA